ncbi:MAG: maleylpyruvate isomerase family mycothiol-dependent enzyme [Acidimicrobiales bacterium]
MQTTFELVRIERLGLVERLQNIRDDQWNVASLCDGWTIRHVLAHLVTPFIVSPPRMFVHLARAHGLSAGMDRVAKEVSELPPDKMLSVLERHAGSTFRPPGMPAAAPLTDFIVHGADIRWALGDEQRDWGDPARLIPVLHFLVSPRALAGFVPRNRLRGLLLVSDDPQWRHGHGQEAAGPGLALAMAMLGRSVALPHLRGEGVTRLGQ